MLKEKDKITEKLMRSKIRIILSLRDVFKAADLESMNQLNQMAKLYRELNTLETLSKLTSKSQPTGNNNQIVILESLLKKIRVTL